MNTSYLKLISGSRITNYLGLTMEEGYKYSHPGIAERNYAYIEIPASKLVLLSDGSSVDKGMRNQAIRVIPPCTVRVQGSYRFEVHPNPSLWEFGTVQGMYYLEPGDGQVVPGFSMQLRRDMDLLDIPWAVRIYMRA